MPIEGRDEWLAAAEHYLEDGVYLDRLRALRESREQLEHVTSGAITAEVAVARLWDAVINVE